MWSLGVEEQFYFLFPAIVLVAYGSRVARAAPCACLRCWHEGRCVPPLMLLATCFALSLGVSTVESSHDAYALKRAFYLLPSRFWQLMLGAMVNEWRRSSGASVLTQPLGTGGKLVVALLEAARDALDVPDGAANHAERLGRQRVALQDERRQLGKRNRPLLLVDVEERSEGLAAGPADLVLAEAQLDQPPADSLQGEALREGGDALAADAVVAEPQDAQLQRRRGAR